MHSRTALFLTLFAVAFAQLQLVALSGNNLLYTLNTASPAPVTSATISGLNSGETVLSIAVYPTNSGEFLYGLTSANRLVYLNVSTAAATNIVTLQCNPSGKTNPTLSIDFDPRTGLLTILTLVTGGTTNLYTANPFTGNCTALPAVTLANGQTPIPAGLAYVAGVVAPYATESLNNSLVNVSTSTGNLSVVGSLGNTSFSGVGGFAYSYAANAAVATLYNISSANSSIYSINLNSGAATLIAGLNVSVNLLGLAVRNSGGFPAGVIGSPAPGFNGTSTTGTATASGTGTATASGTTGSATATGGNSTASGTTTTGTGTTTTGSATTGGVRTTGLATTMSVGFALLAFAALAAF